MFTVIICIYSIYLLIYISVIIVEVSKMFWTNEATGLSSFYFIEVLQKYYGPFTCLILNISVSSTFSVSDIFW